MKLDPSVGQDPADEIKRLTQLARGRSRGGGRRSESTRPTYTAQPQTASTPRDPRDVSGIYPFRMREGGNPNAVFHPATDIPEKEAREQGMLDQSGLNDPSSIYYTGPGTLANKQMHEQSQGQDMAGAYQSLLHSVAMQHGGQAPSGGGQTPSNESQQAGGQPDLKKSYQDLLHSVAVKHGGQLPSGESLAASPGRAGPSESLPAGGPAARDNQVGSQWPAGTPRNLMTGVVPKDPKEADALWGEREAYVKRQQADQYQPEKGKSGGSLSPPPKFPHGGSKEQITQYKEEHQEWEDERQYALAHASLEAKGGAIKTKAELAAVKSEYGVVKEELDSAKAKLESSGGMFTKQDPKLQKEVDKAQSLFDKVKAKRDKLISSTLDADEGTGMGEGTQEDPIVLKSEADATNDMIGKIVSVDGKLHRVEADE